jgi:hypothetical protein
LVSARSTALDQAFQDNDVDNYPLKKEHREWKERQGVMVFRWNDKDDKSVHMECWVDLDGLNRNDKLLNI